MSNRLLSVKSSSVVLFPQGRQISGSICMRIHCLFISFLSVVWVSHPTRIETVKQES